jgi:branched-chain amino acid transport system substrate-binding protein
MTPDQRTLVFGKKTVSLVVAAAFATTVAAGCSSSKSSTGTGTSSGNSGTSGKAIKIGILGSFTGAAASGFTGLQPGVIARIKVANAAGGINGHQIEWVAADDQSTPAGALAAVNKLVQQDKVTAIVEVSSVFYGGSKPAIKSGIPVFGTGFDACTCWTDQSATNLFDVNGVGDYTLVPTTFGTIAKALGVSKMGGLSYTTSASSTLSVKAWIRSAQKAGLQTGFSQGIAFGSTDIGPVVLGIKNSGTDGFYMSTIPNSAFAVAGGLAEQGIKLKGTFLATGYGGDLLANDAAVQAAQGLQFLVATSPVELKTPGTLKMQDGLNKYAGQSMDIPPVTARPWAGWPLTPWCGDWAMPRTTRRRPTSSTRAVTPPGMAPACRSPTTSATTRRSPGVASRQATARTW